MNRLVVDWGPCPYRMLVIGIALGMPMDLQAQAVIYRFGVFEVDLAAGELRKRGVRVKLQSQPFQILAALLEKPGQIVTREELQKRIWPADTFVDFDLSLNTAVRKLRQALGDDADLPRYIETITRRGYRFLAPVGQATAAAGVAAIASPPAATVESRPIRAKRWLVVATAVPLTVVAAAAAYWSFSRSQAEANRSVAVLPFVNDTGDPNSEYLSDGISESVIDLLSQVPGLRVVPRNTMFQYKGREVDFPTLAHKLGVRAVVTGRVMRRDSKLQVSAELIDAARQSQTWGQQFSVDLPQLMFVQQQIAQAVSSKLQMTLNQRDKLRIANRYTQNEQSYELYLKGRYCWNQRTEENIHLAVQDFQQAVAEDPTFAMAYVGIADSYLILATLTFEPPEQAYPQAEQAAVRALELDDSLAEAHASLAAVRENYGWDWSAAEVEYTRAIQLDPNYVTAHAWYAQFLELRGRPNNAFREIKKAQQLDPLALIDNVIAARIYYYARRDEDAIREVNKTLELDPNYVPALLALGQVYEHQGSFDQALVELRRASSIEPGSTLIQAALGHCYGVAGRNAEAQQVLHELADKAKQEYVAPGNLAVVYAGLGDKDSAIRALESAYQERSNWMLYLTADPRFDSLQSDSRFRSLVERVHLPR